MWTTAGGRRLRARRDDARARRRASERRRNWTQESGLYNRRRSTGSAARCALERTPRTDGRVRTRPGGSRGLMTSPCRTPHDRRPLCQTLRIASTQSAASSQNGAQTGLRSGRQVPSRPRDRRGDRSDRPGPANAGDVVRVTTLVPPEGFEPSTSRSGGARSNPLSYEGTVGHSSTAAPRGRSRPAAGARRPAAARRLRPGAGSPRPGCTSRMRHAAGVVAASGAA